MHTWQLNSWNELMCFFAFFKSRKESSAQTQGVPVVGGHGLVDEVADGGRTGHIFVDPVAAVPATQVVPIREASQHAVLARRLPVERNLGSPVTLNPKP